MQSNALKNVVFIKKMHKRITIFNTLINIVTLCKMSIGQNIYHIDINNTFNVQA